MATTIQGGDTTICYGSLRISTDENNSIDNTQGDWTFVEGSEHLYIVSHSHTINNHTHSFTTDGGGSHTHNLLYNHGAFGGSSGAVTPRSGNTPVTPGITGRVSTASNHTHTGSTCNPSDTGTNSQGSSGTNGRLPPYYALCYIMKS